MNKEKSLANSILLVDDDEAILYLIKSILQSHDYEVHCLSDPTKVVEKARALAPDLILLDIMMPEMSGFEVCSQLKDDCLLCEIPVLFLTTLTDIKDKVLGFEVGGSDYLIKPVEPAELLARVSMQLKLRRIQEELASKNRLLEEKIRELEKADDILRRQALYDQLTRLPNRTLFDECLRTALSRAKRRKNMVAVFYIDLDDFKSINDSMGHLAGDQVLQQVASCLNSCLREEDAAARFGGDEFVAVLGDIKELQEAIGIAERLLSCLARSSCPGSDQTISASIGVALFPDHADDPKDLIRQADNAMYMAKAQGKGRYYLAA